MEAHPSWPVQKHGAASGQPCKSGGDKNFPQPAAGMLNFNHSIPAVRKAFVNACVNATKVMMRMLLMLLLMLLLVLLLLQLRLQAACAAARAAARAAAPADSERDLQHGFNGCFIDSAGWARGPPYPGAPPTAGTNLAHKCNTSLADMKAVGKGTEKVLSELQEVCGACVGACLLPVCPLCPGATCIMIPAVNSCRKSPAVHLAVYKCPAGGGRRHAHRREGFLPGRLGGPR